MDLVFMGLLAALALLLLGMVGGCSRLLSRGRTVRPAPSELVGRAEPDQAGTKVGAI
jgi:hypothetical protein